MYNKIKSMWGIFKDNNDWNEKNNKVRRNRDWEKQEGRAVINK